MKKDGLVDAVMQAAQLETKRQAQTVVDALFDTIVKTMARGEEVAITGFGTFRVAKQPARPARKGRNPATGAEIMISAKPASVKPKFRAGKLLKEAVK